MEASGRPECLPSTRQDVLNKIVDWATDPSDIRNVLWLQGLAGSGKSTISTTIASFFRNMGRLGAFIFFDRAFPERSHPSKVIRTLAYKLGSFDRRIGAAICNAVDTFPSINDSSLHVQFAKLIIEPLESLMILKTEGPIVVVFDALDECGNPTERDALVTLLGTELSRLPSVIRILATSRQVDDITVAFEDQPNILTQQLEVSSEIGSRDIVRYFEHQLGIIRRKRKVRLGPDWPGDEIIRELGARSCGLFVWASTVTKFINGFDPGARLAVILQGETVSGAQTALDDLYKTALENAYPWDDSDFLQHFRTVFEIILVLQHPLTTTTLDRLIDLPEGRGSSLAVIPLACVVTHSPTIRLLHPSFADFLFSRPRCGRDMWHFHAVICHRHLAIKCLDRLSSGSLKRNVCSLTLSTTPKNVIDDDVAYACMFWIHHICSINENEGVPSVLTRLEIFLKRHLLHWFEAMSILGKSKDTIVLLDDLHVWTWVSSP